MIFQYLKKQKDKKKKKELIIKMISSLRITEPQKDMYLQSVDILDEKWLDLLYERLTAFVEDVEMNKIDKNYTQTFTNTKWMRKKEAEEKQKEINSYNLLLDNL